MRICVLGNSHVASLKLGLEKLPAECKNLEMVFFASRGGGMQGLRLEEDRLLPTGEGLTKSIAHTSGGKTEVVLAEYDAFLVYGLGFRLPLTAGHLSAAVKRQLSRDTLASSINFRLCSLLREATDKPVYVGHDPQEAAGRRHPDLAAHLPYEAVYAMAREDLARHDVQLLTQPKQTFADTWFTIPSYSAGSVRLDIGDERSNTLHDDTDSKHMNGEFGRVWLEGLLAAVRDKQPA